MHIKYFIILLGITLASCKQQNDLAEKKQQLADLRKQEEDIRFQIMELEKQILSEDSAALTVKKKGKLITTFKVQTKPFTNYIEIQGNAESDQNVAVSSETGGEVMKILVEEGDFVKRGQTLVQTDNALLQKDLADLEVALKLATTTFEKQQRLWNKKIGSEMQYLQAKNAKESLEIKKQKLETALGKSGVTAPVSGTVEMIQIKEGEVAAPGRPLMNVVNLDLIKVKADVPERYVGSVKKGSKVLVEFPSLGVQKEATVTSVGNIINPSNRTFRVEIDLSNKDHTLKANLLALIKMSEYHSEKALTIPTRIIQSENNQDFVYVVAQGDEPVAQRKNITTGKSYGGETEVLSGLTAGDVLVNDGFQYVTDGAFVEIQNNKVN